MANRNSLGASVDNGALCNFCLAVNDHVKIGPAFALANNFLAFCGFSKIFLGFPKISQNFLGFPRIF